MEEDVEAINGLKHLLDFYLLEPTFFSETKFRRTCARKIWSGNLLREPAKFADANDEVTERDTSTKFFARREIFAAKIVRDEKKKPRGTICQVADSLMPQRWCRGVSAKTIALLSPTFRQ
jgi:hypothetical protein